MADEQDRPGPEPGPVQPTDEAGSGVEVPREDWPSWCQRTSEALSGHDFELVFIDDALGEVRLGAGQPFVSIEHDQLGTAVAITIKYGPGVAPVSYVVAEPQELRQREDGAGLVQELTIVDRTGRRTFVSFVA